MVLAAAGAIDMGDLKRFAMRHFGGLPSGRAVDQPAPEIAPGKFHWIKNPDNQLCVDLVFPAFAEGSRDWRTAVMLRRVLDDGISSRLHRAIVDRGGLAYGCEAILDGFHDAGTFEFECALAPEKMPALLGELVTILRDLKEVGPRPEELAKVKERFACDLEFALDSVGEMAGWFGGVGLYREPESFEEALATVRAVTVDDVRRVARALFRPGAAHLVVVGEPATKDLEEARRRLAQL
jgi:predicted Zn-dependent peptidase